MIDTSDEACAIACMLVSNPQGKARQDGDGWQRRVNDLIRALRDERTIDKKRIELCRTIIGGMRCPVPARGDADDTTVDQCMNAQHCGCELGVACGYQPSTAAAH
jgi:hypothetical protein